MIVTPSVVLVSQTRHSHLEGIRIQLLKRAGFRRVAVLPLSEGKDLFEKILSALLADSPRRLAVVTFDEEAAETLERFDALYRDSRLPETEIRPMFGFLDTPSFIRVLSLMIRKQFEPSDPPIKPPIDIPEKIEEESFRIIDETLNGFGFDQGWHQIVRRAVHAAADFEMADLLAHHPEAVEKGILAVLDHCPVIVDVQMVESGISRPLTERFGNTVQCHVADPDVVERAKKEGQTRSTLAMRKVKDQLNGAIAVVGNAPTALFEILRLIREENVRPSLVIGVPVGFVGAAESKELLSRETRVPWISSHGPKGGSTVAVAITNALLRLAQERAGERKGG